MDADHTLRAIAEQALAAMRKAGFEHAQVSAISKALDEFNIHHNEPSLLRSTQSRQVALLGIVDGRSASTELGETAPEAVDAAARRLFADAGSSPQDPANAVSAGQSARIVQGPQEADLDRLADRAAELLDFRRRETPTMMIDEGEACHRLRRSQTLTTGDSDLACSIGTYSFSVMGTARQGRRSSSFNHAGGTTDTLDGAPIAERFGLGEMLRDTERQVETEALGDKFVGDLVLTPTAVGSLLQWLHGQIGDTQLIGGSSLYRESVGAQIASPLFTLRSRFDAPGVAALSSDAFIAAPVEVIRAGRLASLTPSLYGSRKTGLPHVPVAAEGWEVEAGATPRSELVSGVERGAIVGRFSMGNPAANGDFSGVIKNSFRIVGGVVGAALSEAMVAGNMARMLRDIVAVSRERIDSGDLRLPWIRIGGLHFS